MSDESPRATKDRTRRAFSLDEAVALLTQTPKTLDAMLRKLPEGWSDANEGGETWSSFDVVGHLIHGERTDWMPRVRRILESGASRPFEPFDRFAQLNANRSKSLSDLLEEFAQLRAANLADLRALALRPADLDRPGTHPALGPVTLRQLLATWVAHDYDHLIQIARVLANQYADEVGPWRDYMRVISGRQG